MAHSVEKSLRRMRRALAARTPVEIHRSHLDVDRTDGFVLAVLDEWVVLHSLVEGVYLDDLVMLRLDQVTKVKQYSDEDRHYVERAVAGLGIPLETFDGPAHSTVSSLLQFAADRAEIVGVHLECEDGDWWNFGEIIRIGRKRVDLQFIGRDGVWVDFVDAWTLTDITRIEFGGLYTKALERFGEDRPAITSRVKR